MAGNKNVTSYFAPQGIAIKREANLLVISTLNKRGEFDAGLPGLHLRVHEAAKESQKEAGGEAFKPDTPYSPIETQLEKLGVPKETIPANLLAKMQAMKAITAKPVTQTTTDFGVAFNGITVNAAGEVYIRVQSSDVDQITELAEKYPQGADSEVGEEILFVYGEYHGAAEGYCPPINPEWFVLEAPQQTYENFASGNSNYGGSQFGDEDDMFSDMTREQLTPAEVRAREVINNWVVTQRFGDRFTINGSGDFDNPGVMSMFATQRFAAITAYTNPHVFKMVRIDLSSRLLDAAEEHGGQISALRVCSICLRGSKLNNKPNWPLFLKFLDSVVPQCLQYLGGRFVLKGGACNGPDFGPENDFDI